MNFLLIFLIFMLFMWCLLRIGTKPVPSVENRKLEPSTEEVLKVTLKRPENDYVIIQA